MTDPSPPKIPREISGRWVVAAMVAFAVVLTGGMWIYWKLHRAPFLPLEQALAAKYAGSSPQVEGGQRKMNEATPRILRITLRIAFDPAADEARSKALAQEVAAFVAKRFDVSRYEKLEIHFFWPEPEREIKQWSIELPVGGVEKSGKTAQGKNEINARR